ncbi:Hypothetical protein R9X50_00724300 [Acrodontium crateriforme]|uniref:Uncharacterized protein n=1 Tax=Acrodontium crateriforme TaxID=150365 RepID=A0AAQ3MBH6_9PEZI|nr:Hypothetical protein R9X50_00724300 [Acrodontium crateriforme]
MGDFLVNLWESVFTPGATPTLLVATNVTFATLQTLLAALLVATYSIHFLILSVLCGGLWYSINWFAVELRAAQAEQEKADSAKEKPDRAAKSEVEDCADDEGEDTEVEGGLSQSRDSLAGVPPVKELKTASTANESSGSGPAHTASTSASQLTGASDIPRLRKRLDEDLSGEVSTDSEWEKVDGNR